MLVSAVDPVQEDRLVSLNGTLWSAGRVLAHVLAAWLLGVFLTLTFVSLGVLFSVATRNGIMGVIGPVLCALAIRNCWIDVQHADSRSLMLAFAISAVFALLAWWLKAASPGAAACGGIICLLLTNARPSPNTASLRVAARAWST